MDRLLDDVRARTGPLLTVTGAGISLASGIPTFRGADPGAVWSADVTALATRRYFERDPVGSWRWYLGRFASLAGKVPNAGHHALAAIERDLPDCLLVTQNIDGLHRAAGSRRLVEVHGAARRVRCVRRGCENAAPRGTLPATDFDLTGFAADPSPGALPRCPACHALVRPHVLWFDEYYADHDDYQFDSVVRASRAAGVVLFVGTSFSVGVTASLLDACLAREVPAWSIDPSGEQPAPHVRVLAEKAEVALPALAAALAAGLQ